MIPAARKVQFAFAELYPTAGRHNQAAVYLTVI